MFEDFHKRFFLEVNFLPRGLKSPRNLQNKSRDKNLRGLLRGFKPEEFSARFIFF